MNKRSSCISPLQSGVVGALIHDSVASVTDGFELTLADVVPLLPAQAGLSTDFR